MSEQDTGPVEFGFDRPGDATWCLECGLTFTAPDMRETDDVRVMDYHCPLCGNQFAHWHKTRTVEGEYELGGEA